MALSTEPNTPELSIVEMDGDYQVFLTERALPYRPITIGGKQRVEFTWYPGSSNATTQMLGPEESPITMRGFWKDQFVRSITTTSVITTTGGEQVSELAPAVLILTQTLDTMRRRGQVCTFEWGDIKRIGHITEFQQTWHNVHDCEWELTFTPLGQGDATQTTVVAPSAINSSKILGDATQAVLSYQTYVLNATATVKEALNAGLVNEIETLLYQTQTAITLTANGIYTGATALTANVLRPAEAANRMLNGLSQSVTALVSTGATIENRSAEALVNLRLAGGGWDSVPLATQVIAYQWQRLSYATMRASSEIMAGDFKQTKDAVQQELLAVYTAKENQDLSSVSTKYYGRPDYWHQLMNYNGLTESKLSIGQVVLVPKLNEIDPNVLPTNGGY